MPEALGAWRQLDACDNLPASRQCCVNAVVRVSPLRGGTRHIRVVDTEQGGLVTRRRVESNAPEDTTRAKDQNNVRAIVGEDGLSRHADVAAIFCDDPRPIVSDGQASGNQLGNARGIFCACSLGIVFAQNHASEVAEAACLTAP
jgi:hypothetical protein